MRFMFVVIAVLLIPSHVDAQSLRAPSTTFAIAAAADWTTTRYSLHLGSREQDPLLSWIHNPDALVATGAAADAAGLWAIHRWARCPADRDGYRPPTCQRRTIVALGLYTAAAWRVALTTKNLRTAAVQRRRSR